MTAIQLRQATPNDLDQLITLEKACFESDRMSRESYRSLLKKNTSFILIAETDQSLIGSSVTFLRKNSKKARLYSLCVLSEHRQQRIAAQLITAIEKILTKKGCHLLTLEVRIDNLPAIRFYQKQGYDTFGTSTHFYEDGTDALRMRKQLPYENP